ncbi:MAG: Heparinase protein [Chlorobi bacterium]|nr:Heparinase protein [Chlorobiota bacterium]
MAYQKLARRLKFLIASYRHHGPGHVAEVFRRERIRRAYARAPIPLPEKDAFMRGFDWYRGDETFADDFFRAAAGRLPLTRANRKEFTISLFLSLQTYDDILTDAERISEGKFEGLGVCINEPSGTFDWSRDYASGGSWPSIPFSAIRFMEGDGSDVKYPWELSRMYWIGWLGKAYWISNNGAWSRDLMRLLDDWREKNPINTGVNWAMPMEVAIRAFWLVTGFGMFWGAPNIPKEWWIDYLRLAWGHGAYLMENLEYFSNLTNHYISNCFGLLALGSLFAGSADGDTWLSEGRRRMIEELNHQVLADGVHHERSIGYHRLVLEMYLIALVLAERAGNPFPAEARKTIERMAEFMCDYIPPSGTVPQLGDSDDGVIFRLRFDQEIYDHRDTMALAAAIFLRQDFNSAAGGFSGAALMMLGSEGFERLRGLRPIARPASRLYRDGGFAILRNGDLHLLADVGEIGLHGNNDTLSFTLHSGSGAWIIDPGTYCYTRNPRARNELRSTRAHNAPMIDDVEIAEFDGLWRIKRDTTGVRITAWEDQECILQAEHHAYDNLPAGGVTIRRRWHLTGRELSVRDTIAGSGSHRYTVRFTIPGERTVTRISEREVMIAGETEELRFECSEPISILEGWYSPSYGIAAVGTLIQAAGTVNAHGEIAYICRLFPKS